jgi:hypothetical protein
VDEGRHTVILKWKRLHDSIDEVQKIEQEFIKSYQHHHLVILETRCLYMITKSSHVVDKENAVKYNVMKQKTSTKKDLLIQKTRTQS